MAIFRDLLTGASNAGYEKITILDQYLVLSQFSEMIQDTAIVTVEGA